MYGNIKEHLQKEIQDIKDNGLFKTERIITSPQGAEITISTGETVLNFCSNNYLGLSSHPEVVQAAKDAMDTHGFGMSSVRFICGTQDIHKELETKMDMDEGTLKSSKKEINKLIDIAVNEKKLLSLADSHLNI